MFELLDTQAIKVLHASMAALFLENHAPQDQLTDGDWEKAKDLWDALSAEFSLRTESEG